MTSVFTDIEKQDGGAQFLRVDLHIHSYGENGSYDVKDSTMTPANIVDAAIAKNISVISITDHNSAKNVRAAMEYATDKDILVVPGAELSTNEGHILVYAESLKALDAIIGAHKYSQDGKHCLSTMKQCIDSAEENGGFAIASHIEQDKGFEVCINGYGEAKLSVLNSGALLGLEVGDKASLAWFTGEDTVQERKLLAKNSVGERNFSVGERARVIFSDSHKLSAIGRNLNGDERVTRIKLNELNFQALRTAFLDPTARIRVEDVLPESIPYFVGVKFDGGFLNGQVIKFNKNLNCVIGGRGSGKSTLLESVKVGSGNQRDNDNEDRLIDSEVWPDTLTLIYQDEVGNQHELVRKKGDVTINQTDPADGITVVPLESYGQGETARFIQDSAAAPAILTDFLDRFIDFENLKIEDGQIRSDILDNHQKISTLEAELKQLPEYRRLHKDANNKLGALKKQNVKQLVELEESLAEERALRRELDEEIHNHKENIADSFDQAEALNIDELTKGKKVVVGKDELNEIKKLIKDYLKLANETSEDFKTKSELVITQIETSLKGWRTKEAALVQKIEDKKEELIKQGIKPDSAFISSTAKSVADYAVKIRKLEGQKSELSKLLAARKQLISDRQNTKRQICAKRLSFARKINQQLSSTIDYEVNVRYKQSLHSPSFCELLHTTMGWRTSQVPKATVISANISCEEFVTIIERKEKTKLAALTDKNGTSVLAKAEIDTLLSTFALLENKRALEELLYEDRPEIVVSKHIVDDDGSKRTIVREFHKLSLGQQQAIFLTILLHSGVNSPLIIDQPEDNLDSEFIFKTVVTTLRKIKEQRQVIVVTHNANIAVLGDAELILPLRSTNERAAIIDRGSIDASKTKVITCTILEGGDQAFKHRRDLYGF